MPSHLGGRRKSVVVGIAMTPTFRRRLQRVARANKRPLATWCRVVIEEAVEEAEKELESKAAEPVATVRRDGTSAG